MKNVIIVNENDEVIGHKERGVVTSKDVYRVSALWITNSKGEILLAKRAYTKSNNPGKWGPAVAGTNEEGETYESNIYKEAEEEIGLSGIKLQKGPKQRRSGKWNYFGQWYFATVDKPIGEFRIQEKEVAELQWFPKKELRNEIKENPDKFLRAVGEFVENQWLTV